MTVRELMAELSLMPHDAQVAYDSGGRIVFIGVAREPEDGEYYVLLEE